MKKYVLLLILGFSFSATLAQSDSLLERVLIKTLPLKFLSLHPNLGVEIPLTKYVHADIHSGIYLIHIYMGEDIFDLLMLEGSGFSTSASIKFFSGSGNSKSQVYWGPYFHFRYFSGIDQKESQSPKHTLKTISGEIKIGLQNPKRTLEPFARIGAKYVFFDDEKKILPVAIAGFAISLPLKMKAGIRQS